MQKSLPAHLTVGKPAGRKGGLNMAKLIKGLVDSIKKLLGGIFKKKAKLSGQK